MEIDSMIRIYPTINPMKAQILTAAIIIVSGFRLFSQDASGNDVLTFQPARAYYSVVFSSSDLQQGQTYSIYTGGTSTGIEIDGLYSGGTYSGGTFRKSFTINNIITDVNF